MKKGEFQRVLLERIKELSITYENLSKRIGISSVYISRIINGKVVPKDDVIYKLGKTLDLDMETLVLAAHYEKAPAQIKPVFEKLHKLKCLASLDDSQNGDNFESVDLGHGESIPVVGMVQAGEFMPSEDGEYPAGVADGYIYSDRKGRNLFGVKVVNDSMEPDFREGDILVVNPNLEAQAGDYVIAKMTDDNDSTFKKLVVHTGGPSGTIVILRPLNPRYEDIVITDTDRLEIVGKVVERKTLF